MISIQTILERKQQRLSKNFFDVDAGLSEAITADAETLLGEGGWVLFELDFARGKAVRMGI